jgi:hypothetical protein
MSNYQDGFKGRVARSPEARDAYKAIDQFLNQMEDFIMVAEMRSGYGEGGESLADMDVNVARAVNILRSVSAELDRAQKLLR